jgi:hypothetical protein
VHRSVLEKVRVIRTYARIVALVLLVAAVAGVALLGWGGGEVIYHAALGLLFAYAGFGTGDAGAVRAMVGGLGKLVIAIGAVEILTVWFSPLRLVLYPHNVTCFAVGVGSFLAVRYLTDDKSVS